MRSQRTWSPTQRYEFSEDCKHYVGLDPLSRVPGLRSHVVLEVRYHRFRVFSKRLRFLIFEWGAFSLWDGADEQWYAWLNTCDICLVHTHLRFASDGAFMTARERTDAASGIFQRLHPCARLGSCQCKSVCNSLTRLLGLYSSF